MLPICVMALPGLGKLVFAAVLPRVTVTELLLGFPVLLPRLCETTAFDARLDQALLRASIRFVPLPVNCCGATDYWYTSAGTVPSATRACI